MACRWSSIGCTQFGHVASTCVPSAWVSPLLCLSCLVGNLFRMTLVRKINRWSGREDFDAVLCLSLLALRSAPSIGRLSSAFVRRAVSVFNVPWPTFFSSGPCGPCTVKSSRMDVPYCTAGRVCALSA